MTNDSLKLLGLRDAAWTSLSRHELDLERISENGITTENDALIVKMCLKISLGEIKSRRIEMSVDDS